MAWLSPRLNLTTLDEMARKGGARREQVLAERFGFASWAALRAEVERRAILNARDVVAARQRIEADSSWATADLTRWCDHPRATAPLNYMAMLRFDAGRLGLAGALEGTGEMARLLLWAGAPVNGRPDACETPLITAASYGNADVAGVLVDAGADLDALAGPDGAVLDASALLHAAVFGMTDVLDALVTAGAKVRGSSKPLPPATSVAGRSPKPPRTSASALWLWRQITNA
jgi:hypothetical protein